MAWWKDYPWRMIQTNLREIDMVDISAERYVDELKEFNANVVLLNAAGIIASYKTDLDFHFQSPYLQGDSLKDIVDLCHKNNIKVIARTDFSKVRKSLYEQHPEWAFRTVDNGIMVYNGDVQCCLNGEYQQKYAFLILKEMFDKIPFDGLFCNMGGFQFKDYDFKDYGFCHCESCKKKFKEMYGHELPEKADINDPVYGMYLQFQTVIFKKHRENVTAFVKSINNNLCFDDEAYARIEAATEIKESMHRQYHASSNCRVILGDGSSDIICSDTTVDYIGYGLRHISVSPHQQKLRLWQNLVNLGGLDYYFIGRPDNRLDRSAFKSVKEVFAFHKEHENDFIGLKSKAQVLMMRTHRWNITPEEHGWMRTLTESHVSFAEILQSQFMNANLGKYKLLILPDIKYISNEEAEKIDTFVKAGGTAVASGETGLYDEMVGRLGNQVLKCLGIEAISNIRHDMKSSMCLIQDSEKSLFPSLEDTKAVAVGDDFVFTVPGGNTQKHLMLIPPHMYGPPERCYFTTISDIPGMTKHLYGKGFGVLIPWLPGAFYTQNGQSNPFWFMKDVILSLCGIKPLADGELTPMVEVSLSEKRDGALFVQMVNNSGSFGLSYFKPLPVYDCHLVIPSDRCPKTVKTIAGDKVLPFEYRDNSVCFTMDRLDEYEAIKILF